ncbi:MAG: aminotransferase class V-fold PLP-dependent enzyme [Defluviitaleaceae bacterium]|nr:aminotransferase class V-fold PLP-dependent enzyme [Defluviitaleaceae bacterium]
MENLNTNIKESIWGLDTLVRLDNGDLRPAINLDNAATTPPFKQVMAEIDSQMRMYGSIGRGKGQKSAHTTDIYVDAREAIKDFVGADERYTVFYCANTTDGINKLASALIRSKVDMVLSTRMEHHANDLPWRARARVVYAEVDPEGRLKIDDIERQLRRYRGLIKYVTITAASNATGYINEVHHIAKIVHRYGAKIIVDGAQIAAHREFSMLGCAPDESIDFFIFSAHKMYAPYGGGAVIGLKEELNKHIPAFYGGGMVEAVFDNRVCYAQAPDSYEAGSPNFPGLVSMVSAAKTLKEIGFEYITNHEQELMHRAIEGLRQIPDVTLYGDNDYTDDRVGIILFNVHGILSADTADYLAGKHAIAVRHGAFCAHPYIRRLTREAERPGCTPPSGMVRVSFGIYNTIEDVDALLAAVKALTEETIPVSLGAYSKKRQGEQKNGHTRPYDRG